MVGEVISLVSIFMTNSGNPVLCVKDPGKKMIETECLGMPIRQEEIFNILRTICEEEKIYVAVKGSVKGGLIAGTSTVIGGLLFGPPGLAIGGGIGGLLAYSSSGHFHPVGKVLLDLPQRQKDYLHQQISSIIHHLDATDAIMLLTLIRADQMVYQKIIDFVHEFVTSDLNMSIKS